jgi:cobalt-precorrin-5B (C1)-methyltransferase
MARKPKGELRRGWTTGACATAATRAAYTALLTGDFPDPVTIKLPKGHEPAFALAHEKLESLSATVGIIKDAGDDPDVTHGALVLVTVERSEDRNGVIFCAGPGVGTITRPGLPIGVGEPAINPVPRELMTQTIVELAKTHGEAGDVVITVSIEDGERIAKQTWNPRLGIVGGLSILGTTGIVVPYSCSAWIDSIHRGIDVARATGRQHVAACTGSTSERAVMAHYDLPEEAMLDMGDFAGGMAKYLRRHPVPRLTLGGGFGKLTKLAMGHLDLHSGRSQVDFEWLAGLVDDDGGPPDLVARCRGANTANEVLGLCQEANLPIADRVASRARETLIGVLRDAPVEVDVLVIDRAGKIAGRTHA